MLMKIGGFYEGSYSGGMSDESLKMHKDTPEKSEVCTTNTDQVDAEIKKLHKEKEQLMAQYRKVSGDEKREAELKEKIARIEMELRLKDNDTYRRQNAVNNNEG